jgi:predicted Ser/Thr protein kinase
VLEKRDLQLVRLAVRRKWLTAEEGEDCLFLKRKLGEKYTIEEVIRKRGYLDDAALGELAEATSHLTRRRPVAPGRGAAPAPTPTARVAPPAAPRAAPAPESQRPARVTARPLPPVVTADPPRAAPRTSAPPSALAPRPLASVPMTSRGAAPSDRAATRVPYDEQPVPYAHEVEVSAEQTQLGLEALLATVDPNAGQAPAADEATVLGMVALTPELLAELSGSTTEEKTIVGIRLEDVMRGRASSAEPRTLAEQPRLPTVAPDVVPRAPMAQPRAPTAAPRSTWSSQPWAPPAPTLERPVSLRGWSTPGDEPTGPSPDDLTPSIFAPALVQPVQSDPGRAPGGDDDDDALLGLHGELILRRVIGRGSMGVVYLAEPAGGGEAVALKLLRKDLVTSAEHLERFRREAQAGSTIDSPHVVPVLGVGTLDGRPYLALRYIDGFTLRERLDADEPPDLSEALRIARDVALALVASEAAGIVHRDVKPENVIVTGSGAVYLTDFGLARAAGAGVEGLTSVSDTIVGTPNYMAPEQAIGAPVDHRADLYALGATLFHVLAGRPPFEGRSSVSIIAKHVREPAPVLSALDPRVPAPVAALVARLMAKNPADRFATALDLVESLDVLLASLAPVPRAPERVVLPVAIRTFAVGSALVAIALGLALLARSRGLAPWGRPGVIVQASLGGASLVVLALVMMGAIGLVRRGELPLPGSTSWLVTIKDFTGVIGAGLALASAALGPPAALDVVVLGLGAVVLVSWVFGYLLRRAIARQRRDRGGHVLALFGDLRLRRWRRLHVPLLMSLAGLATARFAILAYFQA